MTAANFPAPPVRSFAELAPLTPELVVVFGALALLMLYLLLDDRRRVVTHALAIVTLLVAAALLWFDVGGQGTTLAGKFVRDDGADVLKLVILLVSAAS